MKIGNLTLLKLIGKGTMGEVYLSSRKDTKEYFATKKVTKEYADRPQVKKYFINEISILKRLKHNKIVRLVDLKQTPSHYYIVMEYCNGGSLLSCLRKYITLYKKPFSEEIVQFLMRQIVRGVKYIHEKGIIHRDLKLDNILVKFYSQEDLDKYNMMKVHIKIIDFGISAKLGDNKLAHTALGSPAYMDPFILKKLKERNDLKDSEGYDQSADIWSLGAMCYEMLIGKRVFTGRNLKELYQRVEGGNYTLPTHLSKEVVSFINAMLQYDSKKRLNIEELSRHHFLTRDTKDFSSIDFALVSSKLGANGIYFNTKNNDTLWNIFNEETEVKLNSIPSRILDNKSYPDNTAAENEIENKNKNQVINKEQNNENIDDFQKTEQFQDFTNYNNNIINEGQFISQNKNNSQQNNDNNISKGFREDKRVQYIENTYNYNNNKYNINKTNSNSQIQFNYENSNEFNINNFQNATTDYNYNNMGNMGNNGTFDPYNVAQSNVNNKNNNVPFYEAHTINPHNNYMNINNMNMNMNNMNINNMNMNQQQMNPNYPGDIKVKKQIATTDESCLHQ